MRDNQRGSALLSAILLVAITAMLAIAISFTIKNTLSNQILMDNQFRMRAALHGVTLWARDVMNAQYQSQTPYSPARIRFPSRSFHGIQLQGELIDQQGLFNINLLRHANRLPEWSQLVKVLAPDITPTQALTLGTHITNWLTDPTRDAALYARQNPPYRPAGALFINKKEVGMVLGMTPALYQRIAPQLSALPSVRYDDNVNINSVRFPVLSSFFPHASLAQIQSLYACIQSHKPILQMKAIQTACFRQLAIPPTTHFTVSSHFYLLHASAKIAHQQLTLYSLMMIQPADTQSPSSHQPPWQTQLLWQEIF